MSRVLIVSDSHGSTEVLEGIENLHGNDVDLMIHCGDSELSESDAAIVNFSSVKGNCDFYGNFPDEEIHAINGVRIFVTHGHLYSVKSTLVNLYYKAKELQADIVCFGHSHLLGAEMVDDVLFINPGSIRLPRGRTEKSYAILELESGKAILRIYDFGIGEISELKQEFSLHKTN
ncbi:MULTISPECIES: metallophosphoesterase [Mesobacillus]|uniref:Phosphoesterase n=1 Tax=Mesobacillus selenatarsenatis TaxID=388741 RepID=A0A846TVH5_9BACI|nr:MULTISPECIES: metallophosphoesterase [Mesobacillus]NKE06351.1 metallophosphoesterase [Mesobacillus selenatarsenatis]